MSKIGKLLQEIRNQALRSLLDDNPPLALWALTGGRKPRFEVHGEWIIAEWCPEDDLGHTCVIHRVTGRYHCVMLPFERACAGWRQDPCGATASAARNVLGVGKN